MLVEVEVTVKGSQAALWAAITDIENAAEIISGIEKIEILEKPATGLIGLKWRETRILFGKPATADKWITDAAENAFYKTGAESDGFIFPSTSCSPLPEFLREADENSFGTADVAEPIRVLVLDHFADELGAAFAEPGERIVDVLHGEHDAQITERVHRGAAVIGDHWRRKESGQLDPAVVVRRAHHGNLDAHVAQSSHAACPVTFDWRAPLERKAKFGEKFNRGIDVFYNDADVVHALDRHDGS